MPDEQELPDEEERFIVPPALALELPEVGFTQHFCIASEGDGSNDGAPVLTRKQIRSTQKKQKKKQIKKLAKKDAEPEFHPDYMIWTAPSTGIPKKFQLDTTDHDPLRASQPH